MARLGVAGVLMALSLLAGCAGGPKPAVVEGAIEASAGLNPSINNRASPLVLRVYELKSPTAFNSADFMSLYQRDQAELGADLMGKEEFTLQPGEKRALVRKTLAPGARFIGVLGAYRDLDRAQWRAVVPLQPGKQRLLIRAEDRAITATASR